MTAEPAEGQVTAGAHDLEVRWIFPGRMETAVARWFERFPTRTESREDIYLLDPQLRGLSVKVRGGGALEVKVYRGEAGMLEVAGRARGRMEFWQKWSFPVPQIGAHGGDPSGWRLVGKRRRIGRFALAGGQVMPCPPGGDPQLRCDVELTEIGTRGRDWWTLGFEASGPADLLRGVLEATAVFVFTIPLPGGEAGAEESRSYAQWLSHLPGTANDGPG